METILVVGSGLIGKSWSVLHTGAGYKVILNDVSQHLLDNAIVGIEQMIINLKENGLLRGDLSVKDRLKLITTSIDLDNSVKQATIIQECVPEDLKLKRGVYEKVDKMMTDSQILMSSCSAILPSHLFKGLKHEYLCVIAHPVNPPALAPLVEIVPAPFTLQYVVDKTKLIMETIGQSPITLKKEIVGFGVNRLQYALLGEAWNLVLDGILSVEDVDKVVSQGLGLRWAIMGPLQVTHLNAHDVIAYNQNYGSTIATVTSSLKPCPDLKDPKLLAQAQALCKMVPADKMADRRKFRDTALAKIALLKKSLEEMDKMSRE